MSLDVGGVMEGLAVRCRTVGGLRALGYPADQVNPPVAVVAFPEGEIEYDADGSSDRAEFPVYVVVGRSSERAASTRLAGFMSGAGSTSIKAAIEADPQLGGAAAGGSTRVTASRVESLVIAGVEYLAAVFTVDVIA